MLKKAADQFAHPDEAAVYLCRIAASLMSGIGIGVLAGCMARVGVPWKLLAVLVPIYGLGTGQVMICLPDHFAVSSGVLPALFGVFLLGWYQRLNLKQTALLLVPGVVLAGGICITNAFWPLLFLTLLVWRRLGWSWLHLAGVSLVLLAAVITFLILLPKLKPDTPLVWQVKLWLNLRIIHQPEEAAKRMLRGVVNPAVGPQAWVDNNNFFHVPMLTYEPADRPYEWWPYRGWVSLSAGVWLALFAASLRSIREVPLAVLFVGLLANLVFHNLWGDEYFLYTPHYCWAVFSQLLLAARTWPAWRLALACLAIIPGQLVSLAGVRELVDSIPA